MSKDGRCGICLIADSEGGINPTRFETQAGREIATLDVCNVCVLMVGADRIRVTKDTVAVFRYIANRHTFMTHERDHEAAAAEIKRQASAVTTRAMIDAVDNPKRTDQFDG